MKIFVLNSSGNVGKSLIAREFFWPRLASSLIIEVETVNKGSKDMTGLNVLQFKTDEDFSTVYLKMMENENVIVDVGASHLSGFWEQMKGFAGIEDLFDFFVVPTVPAEKEMTDTFKTIELLRSEGIDEDKIKVIFNKVKKSVSAEFAVLLAAPFSFNEEFFILEKKDLFNDLGFLGKTIKDIYNEDLDSYKDEILSAVTPQEKIKLIKMDLANRQAVKVKEDMDVLFSKITGLEPLWLGKAQEKEEVKPRPKAKAKAKAKEEVKEEVVSEISEDDEDL